MKAPLLIRQIRAHKGKLLAPVHNANGTMHVAVEKKDLIEQLARFGEDECGYTLLKMEDGYWTLESEH